MYLKTNNVIVHGTVKFNLDTKADWRNRKISFYQNTLLLTRKTFNVSIHKNIRFLLCENNLKKLIKSALRKETGKKIKILTARVTNLNHNTTLNLDSNEIIDHVLPLFHEKFHIEIAEITQEANFPARVPIEKLLNSDEKFSFFALKIKLFNEKVCVKFQSDKTKKKTHVTVIVSHWEENIHEFLKHFEFIKHKTWP